MRHSIIALLGLLGGCDDTVPAYPDRDQDGYGDPGLAIDLAPDAPLPEVYGGQLYSGPLHDAPLRFIDDGYSAHYHGREISPIGDFNGDGVPDLAVSAFHWSGDGLTKQGAVYVYLGRGI